MIVSLSSHTQPLPAPGALPKVEQYRGIIYTRKTWYGSGIDAEWRPVKYLIPISANLASIHGRSKCVMELQYGQIAREGKSSFLDQLPFDGRDTYVRILVASMRVNPAMHTFWVGIIPAEGFEVEGSIGSSISGTQRITAFGLEYLLERRRVRGTITVPTPINTPTGGAAVTQDRHIIIERQPSFNERGASGVQSFGNRSANTIKATPPGGGPVKAVASYAFAADVDGDGNAIRWSYRDIIEYLLFWSDRDSGTDSSRTEPRIILQPKSLDSNRPNATDYLDTIFQPVRQAGRNVLDMLREMIDRKRGIDSHMVWQLGINAQGEGGPEGDLELQVYPTQNVELALGTVTIPANQKQTSITVDDEIGAIAEVRRDASNLYDEIVVTGKRTITCFSAATDPTMAAQSLAESKKIAPMQPGWSATDEGAYIAADDAARKTDRFNRVYRVFQLGSPGTDFDWQTVGSDKKVISPSYFDDGSIQTLLPATFWNVGKRLLRELPLPQAADVILETATEHRFTRSFAVVELLDSAGVSVVKWVLLDDPPDADTIDTLGGSGGGVSARITPLDRGLAIDIHSLPFAHGIAMNHFTGQSGKSPVYDYDRMIVTVAVETDNPPQVVFGTPGTRGMKNRTLYIDVPDAEVWYVVPGTIVGVDTAGNLLYHQGDAIVRDDTDRLVQVAAALKAFYAVVRNSLTYTRQGLLPDYELGTLVLWAMQQRIRQDVGSIITDISWDFVAQTTTIETGHTELDPVRALG